MRGGRSCETVIDNTGTDYESSSDDMIKASVVMGTVWKGGERAVR